MRKVIVGQRFQEGGVVTASFAFTLFDLAPSQMRCDRAEDRRYAVSLVFIVFPSGLSGRSRPRNAHLTRELFSAFVQTHQRANRIRPARIDFEDILHRGDKFGAARRRNHPLHFLPRFNFVFFSVWRTASWLMVSTISNSTSRAANNRRVQRA